MLIQDISSPSKYKLSNIEISFSPPYFAQIDSVKKFKFSRRDITWSEYSCNHCQHHPTFYLLSFITICSSIFEKASFYIISLISHPYSVSKPSQTRLLHKFHTWTKPKYWGNWSNAQISQITWPKRNEGGIACNNLTKNCGSNQAKSKRLKIFGSDQVLEKKQKQNGWKIVVPTHWPSPESWGA